MKTKKANPPFLQITFTKKGIVYLILCKKPAEKSADFFY